MGSPSLEVSQSHGDVALWVSGHGRGGLGLDWVILLFFPNLNDSVILFPKARPAVCLESVFLHWVLV